MTIASLNINSIRYKFEQLKFIINDNIDILIIQETKLDETFPNGQFLIEGFLPPFRKDRNAHGGGILVFIKDNIPAKVLNNHQLPNDIEGIFIELNMKNNKWLLFGTYHPPSQCSRYYFSQVGKSLDAYLATYDKYIIVGDFNREETETGITDFIIDFDLNNIVKEKTCYKNPSNPRCIDLILTNKPRSFQHTTTFETGISDFHKMVITSFKCTFDKRDPKEVLYRDYKKFDKGVFRDELRATLSTNGWASFESRYLEILNKHAPIKKKTIRANHAEHMTKEIRKAIMKRSQLANKKNKTNREEDKRVFNKQKNYVNKLCKRKKKAFYSNLDVKKLNDNKMFWKSFKPDISDKTKGNHKITLVKGNDILSKDEDVAIELADMFSNAVSRLNIPDIPVNEVPEGYDIVDTAVLKYKDHPSIFKIIEKMPIAEEDEFNFQMVSDDYILKKIKRLKTNKATTFQNIPGKIFVENADIYYTKITELINGHIESSSFPDSLKFADVNPVHKKKERTNPENYRPVSVLSYTSKVFEQVMHEQINSKMSNHLSSKLCGYRKGFSSQHAIISMVEQWRKSLDNKGYAGAVLMDLSKAFDCMNHELLLAKLYAYGFSKNAIKTIHSYLNNRWQRVKINHSFSSWTELLLGVPQGSVLGPLLFNIYLNDLMWFINYGEVCNYADDTTLYSCNTNLNDLKFNLEKDSLNAIDWFKNNYMKLNTDKCKLLVAGHKDHSLRIKVGDSTVEQNKQAELLGVLIDEDLNFKNHLHSKIKKANSKLAVIKRNINFLSFYQKKIVLSSFVHSHFSYAPLTWLFHSRELENKINSVHKKALRILYNDEDSTFEQLLAKDKAYTVHERNIQILLTEMFKAKNKLEPHLLQGIFEVNDYNGPSLRNSKYFKRPNVNTVRYGEQSLQNLGVRLWNQLPKEIQELDNLNGFKVFIKKWKPLKCPCNICKTYVRGLGYTNTCQCMNCPTEIGVNI